MDDRRQYALFVILAAIAVAAGAALARYRGGGAARRGAVLDAVPDDAWLVVTVDVAALRDSPLARPLLGGGATQLAGLGRLPDACGFDPVPKLRAVAVASPEGGERGDFGVAFDGDLTRDELAGCAEKIIGARGGSPKTSGHEGFTVLDGGDSRRARLAYREGGPFLVGRGAWLDAMMDAAAGKRGRAEGVAGHAALRQALGPSPAVLLTAVLPKPLREKLKAEMNDTIGGGAPTDLPEHERSYAAVLAVEAAGVALGFAGGDRSQVQLAAELRCETPSACADVGKLIERKRAEFSRGFAARLLGLSPLLDSLAVTPSGPALRLTAHAPTAEVSDAIGRLLDLRSPAPPPSAPAPSR